MSGFILTICSLFGYYKLLKSYFIYLYLSSSAVNLISGLFINSGNKVTKNVFRIGILLNLSILFFAFRFRPENLILEVQNKFDFTYMFDLFFAGVLILSIIVLWGFALYIFVGDGSIPKITTLGHLITNSKYSRLTNCFVT